MDTSAIVVVVLILTGFTGFSVGALGMAVLRGRNSGL